MNSRQAVGEVMKRVEAVGILRSLVEGRDPLSGEELPAESVLQRAPVLRALLLARTEIEESVKREKRRVAMPGRAGEPWADDEDVKLMTGYQQGTTIANLASIHGRTMKAIEARLERLGLLSSRSGGDSREQTSAGGDREASRHLEQPIERGGGEE